MTSVRRNEGSILILSLWVVALVSLLAYGVIAHARLATRHQAWERRTAQARELEFAIAADAAAVLAHDTDAAIDSFLDPWLKPSIVASESLPRGADAADAYILRRVPSDEGGKVNINLAPEPLLRALIDAAGYSSAAPNLAAAIVDWRDPDTTGAYEEEQESSEGLRYFPLNRDFRRIEELAFVSGVDSLMLLGEDTNRNRRLDPNEDDGDTSLPLDNADGMLQEGLLGCFTVHGEGDININTAPYPVLFAVFQELLDEAPDADRLAREVIKHRAGADTLEATEDDHAFGATEELASFLHNVLHGQGAENEPDTYLAAPFGFASAGARIYVEVSYPEQGYRWRGELVAVREDDAFQIVEWRNW